MPNKTMRPFIKVEDGQEEARSDRGQEEEADAGRGRRRRPNEGAAAEPVADETQSLRAAHAAAQAQAFGEMQNARVAGLEL
jgi:hypothetical protein